MLAGALVLLSLTSEPARADEFTVGVEAGDSSGEFLRGFRLAVDESPDVSHPPGIEGGDHLGAMDVVIATDPSSENVASLPIVVAPDPDLLARYAGEGPSLLAVTADPREAPEVFTVTVAELHHLLTDRSPDLATRLGITDDRVDDVTIRGYLAGRLVDMAVGATARDPFDAAMVQSSWEQAAHPGSVSEPATERPVPDVGTASDPVTTGRGSLGTGTVLAVFAAVTAAAVAFLTRRRRGS